MYNRIGLQTPRGSGTSGYVQKNRAYKKPIKSKLEFLKEMRKLKHTKPPIMTKPNKEIITHKKKREIYVILEEMRDELEQSGEKKSVINAELEKIEKKMLEKFQKNELIFKISKKDSHLKTQEKMIINDRVKNCFGIRNNYIEGSAFNFELQEKIKLEKMVEREIKQLEILENQKNEVKEEKLRENILTDKYMEIKEKKESEERKDIHEKKIFDPKEKKDISNDSFGKDFCHSKQKSSKKKTKKKIKKRKSRFSERKNF